MAMMVMRAGTRWLSQTEKTQPSVLRTKRAYLAQLWPPCRKVVRRREKVKHCNCVSQDVLRYVSRPKAKGTATKNREGRNERV